jgi:hypothetical protein
VEASKIDEIKARLRLPERGHAGRSEAVEAGLRPWRPSEVTKTEVRP